jgi:hypothetical protein
VAVGLNTPVVHQPTRTFATSAKEKFAVLQVFLNNDEQPRYHRSAFTRQRSLVRIQHRPLTKSSVLQVYPKAQEKARIGLGTFVQQSCSNAVEVMALATHWDLGDILPLSGSTGA